MFLLILIFLIIAVLLVVKWYVIVFLICIFQMADNVEHLFLCLLAFCIFGEMPI